MLITHDTKLFGPSLWNSLCYECGDKINVGVKLDKRKYCHWCFRQLNNKLEKEETVATLTKPTRVPAKPSISAEQIAQHEELCTKLGVVSTGTKYERAYAFMEKAGILMYPYDLVFEWMRGKANAASMRFVWKPIKLYVQIEVWGSTGQHGEIMKHLPYEKTIPTSVLYTADRLKTEFPELEFYVSDYEAKAPDPFMAFRFDEGPLVVFEFWDEPGFERVLGGAK